MTKVDPTKLDAVMAATAKRFSGARTMRRGNDTPKLKRVSYGSIELDMATMGGAPMGRMIRPWGSKSSCKSLATYKLFAEAQKYRDDDFPDGLQCVLIDVEGTYHEEFVQHMGVDTDKLIVIKEKCNLIEEIGFQILDTGLMEAAHVFAIDSCSHAIARQEWDSPADKHAPRGARARAWGEVLRKIEAQKTEEHMFILIDQVRTNQATGTEMSAGSHIFDHSSAMDLHHRSMKKLYRQADGTLDETYPRKPNYDTLGGEVVVDGRLIGIEVNKNKVGRPFGKAQLILDLDTMEFDRVSELVKVGIFLDVIEKNGAWYKVPGASSAINGEKKLKEYIREDPGLAIQVIQAKDRYIASGGKSA